MCVTFTIILFFLSHSFVPKGTSNTQHLCLSHLKEETLFPSFLEHIILGLAPLALLIKEGHTKITLVLHPLLHGSATTMAAFMLARAC